MTTGNIIVLAYPDTFVTVSDEWICRFLPLVGLGTKEYIKAGHAAIVLVNNENGNAQYFDFGRYITPDGMGRVRGANTDAELEIPFNAVLDGDGKVLNLNDFLLWLDAHPEKTHGSGRLLASVCEGVNFEAASNYIHQLQALGSTRYGAFAKRGSNCSRFVTDTILASISERKIKKALRFNKRFTPSTVGNVEKAAAQRKVFEVLNGEISEFKSSAFKENLRNYFDKNKSKYASEETKFETEIQNSIPGSAQKLSGIGSNAWFEFLKEEELPKNHFRIKRYNDLGNIDFDGVYYSEEFLDTENFQIAYDSHCLYCHVIQKNKKIQMKRVGTFASFNLSQKTRSA